ncbi:MAG TPA: glycosyltransferase [Nocardioides sp.]
MRIALVAESFYPAVDGATTTVKNLADRLIDRGHEVLIVAPGPGLASYRRSRVARIRPLDKPGKQVRAALEGFRPELVQVHSPGRLGQIGLGRKALKHATLLGVPALTVQQSVVGDLTAEYWLRKVAARSDRVVVTCRWMQSRLAYLGVDAPLWEPGVATAAFGPQLRDDWLYGKWSRRRSPQGPRVVVGYVGSLHKRNGVRRLAELAGRTDLRLVVIGDGPQRIWLKTQLPDAKFAGALETGELATAMATFDLLLHPGTAETDCHALREAAASGIPVVAPAAGGTPDVVGHQRTGLLYDPAEDEGLRRAVGVLVRDADRRAELGAAARKAVAARDWTVAADELIDTHHVALFPGAADGGLRIA